MFLVSFVAVFSVGIFSTAEAYRSCTWQKFPDNPIIGGELIESATTLEDCQSVCEQTADCVSVDFVPCPKKCYLLKTQEGKTIDLDVDHYDHVCVEIDPCSPNPCQNGGTCSESDQSYKCSCPSGYSGKNCESFICPSGFDYVLEIEQCLRLFPQLKTWSNSRDACNSIKPGVKMATIMNSAKQAAVHSYLEIQFNSNETSVCRNGDHGKMTWISGQTKDPNQCGTPYMWKPSHEEEIPFNYTSWGKGEPSCGHGMERCTHVWRDKDYTWNDADCSVPLCFLCEF